ncbi:MAG TPA: histidine kinase, partial [Cyanobacteria bacterium UBA8543]|nr:histidine kinase [Cyanobacteria bacterium UBA8543]
MLSNLKLASKFTLLLSLVFVCAIVISGAVLSQTTQQQAESDVAYRGQILMEVMNSVRNYTNDEVNPILKGRIKKSNELILQAIPSYSVSKVFENLRKNSKYQNYLYKDAVLRPNTYVPDEANTFEKKIIKKFQKKSALKEDSGFTTTRKGKSVFYYAQPIIEKKKCLRCYNASAEASKRKVAISGNPGFGKSQNNVLGTRIIYVPSEEVFAIAHRNLLLFMSIFIGIFALVIWLINFLLKRSVIQPIRPMARLAQKISNDQLSSEQSEESEIKSVEKLAKRSDELGQLAQLFQQMAQAISTREQSFAQQLQQIRNKGDVRIAYFKKLQQKAQTIRSKSKNSSQS